jgi:transposase
MTRAQIGEIVGVHADTVGRWIKLSARQLQINRGGRKLGHGRHLNAEQEKHIQRLIIDKLLERLKSDYVLWTRKAVMEQIEQETGLSMRIRTVGEYPRRWGFTPQKPIKSAYEQNLKAAQLDWRMSTRR